MKKDQLINLFTVMSSTLPLNVTVLKGTGRNGAVVSRDYYKAIGLISEYNKANPQYNGLLSHITSCDDLWKGLHPATAFRLHMDTPCLALRYEELKESEQNALFDDPSWEISEKINGCRAIVFVCPDGRWFVYSRNVSDTDCSLLEYSKNIMMSPKTPNSFYAIDTEIVFQPGVDISSELKHYGLVTDSQLEATVALLHMLPEKAIEVQQKFYESHGRDLFTFKLIAPLYVEGKNYIKRTLGEGMEVYNRTIEIGQSLGLNVEAINHHHGTRAEKEIFLDTIINNGGEGVVFWNHAGNYCTSENRSKTSFIKLKRKVGSTGMGDTIDGFVTGFTRGTLGTKNEHKIGAIEFSIYVQDSMKTKVIGYVSGIDDATRNLFTWNNAEGVNPQEYVGSDNQTHFISLNPDALNMVAELSGQALSSVNQTLEHAKLIMWRTERSAESCVYSQEWIDSQTTNNGIQYSGVKHISEAQVNIENVMTRVNSTTSENGQVEIEQITSDTDFSDLGSDF